MLLGYELIYCSLERTRSLPVARNLTFSDPRQAFERLTRLTPNTTYKIEVRAFTRIGRGLPRALVVDTRLPPGVLTFGRCTVEYCTVDGIITYECDLSE